MKGMPYKYEDFTLILRTHIQKMGAAVCPRNARVVEDSMGLLISQFRCICELGALC